MLGRPVSAHPDLDILYDDKPETRDDRTDQLHPAGRAGDIHRVVSEMVSCVGSEERVKKAIEADRENCSDETSMAVFVHGIISPRF